MSKPVIGFVAPAPGAGVLERRQTTVIVGGAFVDDSPGARRRKAERLKAEVKA